MDRVCIIKILSAVFVLVNIFYVEGWRPYTVKFYNLTYGVPHPDIFDFEVTYEDDGNIQRFGGYGDVQRQLPDAFAHVTILVDSGNGNFDKVYFNKTFSVCKFLEKDNINPIITLSYDLMSKYIEMPKGCPIIKKRYSEPEIEDFKRSQMENANLAIQFGKFDRES
ncbi:hypothetical protein Bhyg_12722, partial [Pseudolycoriella hygida]